MQEIIQEKARGVFFALCKSCYWTASLIEVSEAGFTTCPVCLEDSIECLPITRDEVYSLTITKKEAWSFIFP